MESLVKYTVDEGVASVTLARPGKRNALSREFIEQLNQAVQRCEDDPSVRVLVFQAEGTVFCAGMDLGEMQQRATSEDGQAEWQRDSEVYADLLSRIFHLKVPTIAALQGPVLAGGVGLVLACDMIVATDHAFVMLPEPMRGITAAMVTPFLVYRIGAGPATQMLLSGQPVAPQRCLELGLFQAVTEPVEIEEQDLALQKRYRRLKSILDPLIESVLTGSQSALAITKRHIQHCAGDRLDALLKDSISVSAEARGTADAREGLAAFLEKRAPNWRPSND